MGSGTLRFEISTANGDLPVAGALIKVMDTAGNVLFERRSDAGGLADDVTLDAPDAALSQDANYKGDVFGKYNVSVTADGFSPIAINGVQIFDGVGSVLPVVMYPQLDGTTRVLPRTYDIPENTLKNPEPRNPPGEVPPMERVLREVIIPDFITVKLGPPDSHAQTTRVPFIDYIKNVASSEIYPDWPKAALEANILCQISFALNRVYTEWYPTRGYNFNITNSTRFDQFFVPGRNIFDTVSVIVDRIFNHYIARIGFKEPYFAEYCNGTTATCPGLSQWGTVTLANQGYAPLDILKYYYPNDIEIVVCNRFSPINESYPGQPLSVGSSGEAVQQMQIYLNRISGDFPLIPRIQNPNGIFGADTQAAVRAFQKQFNLTQDGVIGRATWNYISRIYVAVKKLALLNSEGERLGIGKNPPTTTLRQGARGENVVQLQFLLNYIAQFYGSVPEVVETGVFGAGTAESVTAFQREFGLTADGASVIIGLSQ
ncbi:MAG: peptidoglycan-binding protein [Defluviitaleaceae bacterium]|nr:peptidoglycan-binding protein [Defluviitaleaceae bacterium]